MTHFPARPPPTKTTDYFGRHLDRTRGTRLGSRQSRILACVKARARIGKQFPSLAELAAELAFPHNLSAIEQSLIGLSLRGLIEIVSTTRDKRGVPSRTWRLTEKGRIGR